MSCCQMIRRDLFLHDWEIVYVFSDEEEGEAFAKIGTLHNYLSCKITVFPNIIELWEAEDKEGVFKILLHEFCHVFTDPMYKIAIDAATNTNVKYIEAIREEWTQRMSVALFCKYKKKEIENPE